MNQRNRIAPLYVAGLRLQHRAVIYSPGCNHARPAATCNGKPATILATGFLIAAYLCGFQIYALQPIQRSWQPRPQQCGCNHRLGEHSEMGS